MSYTLNGKIFNQALDFDDKSTQDKSSNSSHAVPNRNHQFYKKASSESIRKNNIDLEVAYIQKKGAYR